MRLSAQVCVGAREPSVWHPAQGWDYVEAVSDLLKPTGLNSLQLPSTNLSPRARMKPRSTPVVGSAGDAGTGTVACAGGGAAAGVPGSSAEDSVCGGAVASAGASAGTEASLAVGSVAAKSAADGDIDTVRNKG